MNQAYNASVDQYNKIADRYGLSKPYPKKEVLNHFHTPIMDNANGFFEHHTGAALMYRFPCLLGQIVYHSHFFINRPQFLVDSNVFHYQVKN